MDFLDIVTQFLPFVLMLAIFVPGIVVGAIFLVKAITRPYRAYTVTVPGTVVGKELFGTGSAMMKVEFTYTYQGVEYRGFTKLPVKPNEVAMFLPDGKVTNIQLNPNDPTDFYWNRSPLFGFRR